MEDTQPIAPNQKSTANAIAAVLTIGFPTLVTLVYFVWLRDAAPSTQQTAYAIGKAIQFAFPVVWVWCFFRYRFRPEESIDSERIETSHSPNREGLSVSLKIPNWLWAIGFGIDVCLIMAAAAWLLSGTDTMVGLTTELKAKISGLGVTSVWKYALLGLFYALVHSFLEEYYWRWFVYDLLKRFVSIPMANLISSLGFMAHHVVLLSVYFGIDSPMTWICSAGVAIGGIYWAWLYQKTGSLIWPWISHMVVDAGIFALGYFLIAKMFAA